MGNVCDCNKVKKNVTKHQLYAVHGTDSETEHEEPVDIKNIVHDISDQVEHFRV